jgi:tRNA A-37 threonylcarbamoyl transferase component Bud32
MDAAQYSRMRELFLAAEELPPDQQEAFLRVQTEGNSELLEQVRSLLAEHDADSARIEGEQASPVPRPPGVQVPGTKPPSGPRRTSSRGEVADQTTRRGSSNLGSSNLDPSTLASGATAAEVTPTGATPAGRGFASEITQHGAQRTHASPRYGDTKDSRTGPSLPLWAKRSRESRRSNSRWLWLAALLPTALIGWWTFRQVQATMRESVRNELVGVADSVTFATERFLNDKARLVESWSRQPEIRQAIAALVDAAEQEPSTQDEPAARRVDLIRDQLHMISGYDDVEFVVWNDSYITIATWPGGSSQIGQPVDPSGAANLNRVMRGETVLFGPQRGESEDAAASTDSNEPVMAIIVPVPDEQGRVIAAMHVSGFGMFDEFDRIFSDVAASGGVDAYAVNEDGIMLSESRNAAALAAQGLLDWPAERLAAGLRVADPGVRLTRDNAGEVRRGVCPLTLSAAGATSGNADVRIDQYNNYAGSPVVGAWRWNPDWDLGVVIERDAEVAYAPAGIVRFSFLLLGSVLSITAFAAAAKIASRSARDHAAVHPLSRYELVSELGSGGMGVVYRARHRQLGRDTALKVLRGDRHNKEDRLRFDREARLAASLSSPHSVMIYDYGRSEEGQAFCVMEFLRGLTLNEVVARSGHQPFGRVLFILSQVCDALSEAHGLNLLHRDIKPQNVMLSLDASVGDWAVVFDYGLAKPLQPDAGVYQTSETVWAGTPMYMAPERFRAPAVMDPRSDIYSVGCVAYYLLAGRPPFIECDPESLFALIITQQPISIAVHRDGKVPDELNEMVVRCMAKNSDDRFETIHQLSGVIDQLRQRYPWTVEDARAWWRMHGDE